MFPHIFVYLYVCDYTTIINRYGANVSLYKTLATMWKMLVSSLGERVNALVIL